MKTLLDARNARILANASFDKKYAPTPVITDSRIGILLRKGVSVYYCYINGVYHESKNVCDVENILNVDDAV
jgi:hypothetical protein